MHFTSVHPHHTVDGDASSNRHQLQLRAPADWRSCWFTGGHGNTAIHILEDKFRQELSLLRISSLCQSQCPVAKFKYKLDPHMLIVLAIKIILPLEYWPLYFDSAWNFARFHEYLSAYILTSFYRIFESITTHVWLVRPIDAHRTERPVVHYALPCTDPSTSYQATSRYLSKWSTCSWGNWSLSSFAVPVSLGVHRHRTTYWRTCEQWSNPSFSTLIGFLYTPSQNPEPFEVDLLSSLVICRCVYLPAPF